MKLFRVILVCNLLLLVASPMFAITCSTCIDRECEGTPNSQTRCRPVVEEGCETVSLPSCVGFADHSQSTVFAEWSVASIEINRPACGTTVTNSPAAVARAETSQTAVVK